MEKQKRTNSEAMDEPEESIITGKKVASGFLTRCSYEEQKFRWILKDFAFGAYACQDDFFTSCVFPDDSDPKESRWSLEVVPEDEDEHGKRLPTSILLWMIKPPKPIDEYTYLKGGVAVQCSVTVNYGKEQYKSTVRRYLIKGHNTTIWKGCLSLSQEPDDDLEINVEIRASVCETKSEKICS